MDLAYDVVVGRLPMRTATQVTNYLNKVMTYEAGWNVTNKIMLGGPYAWDTWTGTARPSDDVTGDGHAGFRSTDPAHDSVSDSEAWLRRLYRDGIHDYWPAQVNIMCDTITSWDTSDCGSYLQSSANTASKFNQNYTHLMFSGHGAPQEWGLESGYFDDADASSQTGLTAFVYTDACLTGHFDKNSNNIDGYNYTTEPCLGEAFLRNTRVRGGALAYMGCARYGWGEPGSYDGGPSTVYAYKFYKRMYETTNRTIGLAFAMHKADMASLSSKDDCERWIQFGVNLLGDPALKMPRDVPVPSAPSFTSASSFGATTGVEKTHSVVASGYPTPVLSLQSSSASAGSYSFVASSGVLTYQPPAADEGTKTFTFVATNTQGSVTQIVSATVTLAPPAAPASIWASATNTTDFTAAWSSVADATGYRLDVSTNETFSAGGGGGGSLDISGYDLLQFDSSQTYTLPAGTVIEPGGYVIIARNQDKAAFESQWGVTLAANVVFLNSGGSIPQLNGSETFLLRDASDVTVDGQTALAISGQVTVQRTDATADATSASSWTSTAAPANSTPGSGGVGNGTGGLVINEYSEHGTYTYEFVELYYDAASGPPSYVAGYSNRTVAGTSQSVTGLTAGATYYFRARAVNGGGSSPNTSVASVTTLATLSAPVFGANPGPVAATAGVDAEFTVSASGVPAPTLALDSTTAEPGSYDFNAGTGDMLYVAPQSDEGQQTFAFSAVNSQGSAYQTVTVNVAAATAPAFTGGAGPYSTTAGVEVAFTVSASGTAPTLALQSQTASSGYSFTPATGAFTYTPPAGDVGTQTFTFTAANAAGTVTQVTSVSVAAVPTAPDAPASVWASGTNDNGFTAAWSASAGATSYRLDVGTNETFSAGGGSVNLMSNAGFESGDSTSWDKFESEYAVTTTDPEEGTYAVTCSATSTRDLMQMVDITGDGVTEYEISYWYRITTGDGSDLRIWASWAAGGQVSGDSLQPATYDAVTTNWTKVTYHVVPQSGASTLNFEVRTYSGATVYLDNFFVGTAGGGSTPSYVSGYSNRTVSGTSESVTGLVAEAGYYFRVRAVNDVGMSGDSSVASVTTLAESVPGTPPVVDAIPAQTANVGSLFDYTVTATATDGDPILAYGCSSAVDTNVWDFDVNTGYFVFEPTAVQLGTNLFDFTATDKDGASAAVQMSVKVYSAAASNEFTQWIEDQEQDPSDPEFSPEEDADDDGINNYDEYLADTDPNNATDKLELTGDYMNASQAGGSTGQIEFSFPASPNRYYQLETCTDLETYAITVTDLGWGQPGMVVTSTVPGTWFGTIRVLLEEPVE